MAADVVSAIFMVASQIARIIEQNKEVTQECGEMAVLCRVIEQSLRGLDTSKTSNYQAALNYMNECLQSAQQV